MQAQREFCVEIDLNQDVADWFDEHMAKSSPFHTFNSPTMCKGESRVLWGAFEHENQKALVAVEMDFQPIELNCDFLGAKLYLTNVTFNAQQNDGNSSRLSFLTQCCGFFVRRSSEDAPNRSKHSWLFHKLSHVNLIYLPIIFFFYSPATSSKGAPWPQKPLLSEDFASGLW